MTRTNTITLAILRLLKAHGHEVWRQNTGAMKLTYTRKSDGRTMTRRVRFGKRGVADIIGVLKPRGTHIEIEIKQGRDRLTMEQLAHQKAVRRCGGIHMEVRNLDAFLIDVINGSLMAKPPYRGRIGSMPEPEQQIKKKVKG